MPNSLFGPIDVALMVETDTMIAASLESVAPETFNEMIQICREENPTTATVIQTALKIMTRFSRGQQPEWTDVLAVVCTAVVVKGTSDQCPAYLLRLSPTSGISISTFEHSFRHRFATSEDIGRFWEETDPD